MNRPLERFNKLTLAAESALAANDFPGFRALLDARDAELSKLEPKMLADAEETLRLDARLQAAAAVRFDGLRTRMRQLAHVTRTIRAARAAQAQARQIDLSG